MIESMDTGPDIIQYPVLIHILIIWIILIISILEYVHVYR